jgi:hypothetical protein
MDAIVGFPMHRGVLALGQRATPSVRGLLEGLPAKALVMGLLGIGNHDNMGGLFRNAAAFGVDAVLVGSDCCDPLYRKSIRVSVGAAITTPFARLDPEQAMPALLAAHGFEVLALSPTGEADVAELTAQLKGRLPRLHSASEDELDRVIGMHAKEAQPGDTVMIDLVGRRVSAVRTTRGLRATVNGKEITPKSVERYLEQKFGGNLDEVRTAFEGLAQSYTPEELQQHAYDLYQQFRPPHPVETAGWGAADVLDLERLRKMAKKE